jgi:hypothetical protein
MEIKAIGCEPLSLKRVFIKDGHTLKAYRETSGYRSLEKALSMSQDEIIQQVKDSVLFFISPTGTIAPRALRERASTLRRKSRELLTRRRTG